MRIRGKSVRAPISPGVKNIKYIFGSRNERPYVYQIYHMYLFHILRLFFGSCKEDSKVLTEEELRTYIKAELSVGAGSDKIENLFRNHNIVYSYDAYAKKYQGIIRIKSLTPWSNPKLSIEIYVDEEKRFLRADIIKFLK